MASISLQRKGQRTWKGRCATLEAILRLRTSNAAVVLNISPPLPYTTLFIERADMPTWNDFVKTQLVDSKNVKDAVILSLADGTLWGATADFCVSGKRRGWGSLPCWGFLTLKRELRERVPCFLLGKFTFPSFSSGPARLTGASQSGGGQTPYH